MTATIQPDVSFIIAAYNAEETLARAIKSALDQENVIVEAIVIDDCSADGTRAVAESFQDARVRLISLAKNGGPSAARNAGLEAATGRWVATLDSDDEMRPLRLRRMIDLAENLDARVAVDNLEVVTLADAKRITMFSQELLAKQPFLMLAEFIDSNILFKATHNFGYMKPVFRRDFLEQHGLRFDESIKVGEDYLFLASALAHGGKCVVDPHPGYIYHIREGSISRVLKLHHVDQMIAADRTFLGQHALDRKARAAQRRRARSLVDARSFLLLIDGIKQRSIPGILGAAWRNPRALRHLKLPIGARIRRLSKRFLRSSKSVAAVAVPDISNLGGGPHSSKG